MLNECYGVPVCVILTKQESIFKLLEYVICSLNFVAVPELGCLCNKIRLCTALGDSLPLRTLIKLINFDVRYAGGSPVVMVYLLFLPVPAKAPQLDHKEMSFKFEIFANTDQLNGADICRDVGILPAIIDLVKTLLESDLLKV